MMRTKTPITTPAPDLRRAHSPRTEPARPGPGPADPPRSAWLPAFGVAALFALVLLSLHLAVRLKESLGHELADRLRVASGLAAEVVAEAGSRPVRPGDPTTLQRLEEIRRATAVTDIVLYDGEGGLVGGVYEGELNPAVPPRVRIAAGATGDAAMREPERDAAGGLVVVLPMASGGSIGAVLVRLDASRDRGLAAAEFLLTLAKILGGTVAAAGVLILLRWSSRSTADSRGAPASTSDVDLVLGTMKEVMSTLKDSESEYRDRMTAAVQDAAWIRRTNDLILESIGSGLVAFDHDGRITMFNPAAEEIFATPRGRAIGRAVDSVFPEGTPMASLARDLLDRERARRRVELSMPGGDGEPRWLGISSSVLRDARGQAAGGLLL
ncbi:MAG: PAS domain-containing protein, partial [Gemmatimonadetes bacterium]|nr:PAS domain-containing protein [Gemmatimonadota bacterium]